MICLLLELVTINKDTLVNAAAESTVIKGTCFDDNQGRYLIQMSTGCIKYTSFIFKDVTIYAVVSRNRLKEHTLSDSSKTLITQTLYRYLRHFTSIINKRTMSIF